VPRLWTPEEADRRLPGLTELVGQLKQWAQRLQAVDGELGRLAEFWGAELGAPDHPDHELAERLERERSNLSARLDESVKGLAQDGIEVKDLSSGLVDFYGFENGELVYLCWKVGESEVGFFHSLTGGFSGRRPLPSRVRSHDAPPR
jgi:hypothetical protein